MDMLPYTGENIFSSTYLLKNNSENLPRPMLAVRAVGRPPGLPTKRSRKARKVLYPARVRKYLPRPEKDLVKRWLFFFVGIVLMQVLTEEPEQERLAGGKGPGQQPLCAPAAPPAARLGAAANSSREDRAVSEALAITFSSAYKHQPLRQTTADVPQQAKRQPHAFCRQCLTGFSRAEH